MPKLWSDRAALGAKHCPTASSIGHRNSSYLKDARVDAMQCEVSSAKATVSDPRRRSADVHERLGAVHFGFPLRPRACTSGSARGVLLAHHGIYAGSNFRHDSWELRRDALWVVRQMVAMVNALAMPERGLRCCERRGDSRGDVLCAAAA